MFLYALYIFISPFLWLILLLASFFNIKIKDHWNELWTTINSVQNDILKNRNNRKIILFHAASAGEFEQLIPILKLINKKKYYIVQSFFSPTIYNKQYNTTLADSVCYHPFDFIFSSFLFFKKIKPEYYIITRHDIWPSHILIAKILKIKTFIINANLYKESKRLKFPIIYLNKWIFNCFNKILVPSTRIKNNVKLLTSHKKIIITGDSRFDRIDNRMKHNNSQLFPKNIHNSRNIIFGSIIESDYEIIFKALKEYFPNGDRSLIKKNIKIIMVPHEIDSKTISNLITNFKNINMEPKLYNNVKELIPNIIIVNKVGILADLYKYSNLAYIGGGFGEGVHSVIEPAIYGVIVTFGPNINILDEAIEMTKNNIGFIINTKSDLKLYFEWLNHKSKIYKIKKNINNFITNNLGASKRIINEIFN